MPFVIRNEIKVHLKKLNEFQPDVINEFCKLSQDYLENGPNEKKYSIAAKKLSTTTFEIQSIIESLVCLLIEATQAIPLLDDFDILKSLSFNDEQIQTIWNFINNKNSDLGTIVKHLETNKIRFRDLEWRLEARIASRTLLQQVTPSICMKFHLDSENVNENKEPIAERMDDRSTKREILVTMDLPNLRNVISVLEDALLESKTHRTRNFIKAFQQ